MPDEAAYIPLPGEASDPVTPNQMHVFAERLRASAARVGATIGEPGIHHDESGNLVVTAPITSWSDD